MVLKNTDKTIYNVVWESNVDGDFFVQVNPCDTLEAAIAKVEENKNEVLTNGHFMAVEPEDVYEENNERHYFIMDNCDNYYEDIYIIESNLITKSE